MWRQEQHEPAVQSRAAAYLTQSQMALSGLLLLSILLRPYGVLTNHSISYYGAHRETVVPYVLAFVISGALMLRATGHLPKIRQARPLVLGLRAVVGLSLGVICTPYTLSPQVEAVHSVLASTTFDIELGLAVWLAFWVVKKRWCVLLLFLQSIGAIVSLLSLLEIVHLFAAGELLFCVSFAVLLVRAVEHLSPVPSSGLAAELVQEG